MVAWFRSSDLRLGGEPEIFVKAMSMASAEVPDIRPRTRRGREGIFDRKGDFTTEGVENTERKEAIEGKKTTRFDRGGGGMRGEFCVEVLRLSLWDRLRTTTLWFHDDHAVVNDRLSG